MKKTIALFSLLLVFAISSARERLNFDNGWRFCLADSAQMSSPSYDDSKWRKLNLPHDWAIEGDFSASAPSGNSGGGLAEDQVFFEVEGGRIVGVDNGNPVSMERFKDTKRKAFNGRCLVVVATDGGDVTLRAKGYQLTSGSVVIKR